MSFLYLSCSAVMDSPGGEFNSYKTDRCEVLQARKNIVIVEDFRIMDTIYECDRNEIVHMFFSDNS